MFYTYAYLRKDGTPYYIGKGCKNRVHCKYRNVPIPSEDRILILKNNLTEEEAFKHEIYMISVFGRKDLGTGCLYNRTNGGDGASGWIPSEETRRKISVANSRKRRSQEVRDKISASVAGFIWYTNGTTSIQCREHPGEGWEQGRCFDWHSPRNGGMKWYHKNGQRKMFSEHPGDGWQLGMLKPPKGKRYYNNGSEHVLAYEPPDDTWVPGRLRKS